MQILIAISCHLSTEYHVFADKQNTQTHAHWVIDAYIYHNMYIYITVSEYKLKVKPIIIVEEIQTSSIHL